LPAVPVAPQASPEHKAYHAWQAPSATPGAVQLEQVILHLSATLSDDAILTNGAGNYAGWLHRYFCYKAYRTQLAPTSGSMGYGLPAAVSAKLAHPERAVVCLAGDGCFQMSMQEFGTAVQYGANIIVIVVNNGVYGTIRMHQQKTYPDRPSGTDIRNPDFAALARSYGGFGATITKTDQFADAFAAARAAHAPAILDVQTDPRAVTTRSSTAF